MSAGQGAAHFGQERKDLGCKILVTIHSVTSNKC